MREALGYLLAVGARRYGILVHAFVALSDHYHAVVTDPRGEVSRFLAWFNRLSAVVVNQLRGRREALWNSCGPNVLRLESEEDIEDKLLYLIANPVAARLVSRPEDWPGLRTTPESLVDGVREEFDRPSFFDADGQMPPAARLEVCCPPRHRYPDDPAFAAALRRRLDERLRDLWRVHRQAGARYLGAEGALQVDWQSTATSAEPRHGGDPHIAARDPELRRQAIDRLRGFRRAYRVALEAWQQGDREVIFPAGTYAMRVRHGVRCHPPPLDTTELRSAA